MDPETQKRLLEIQLELAAIISRLEPTKRQLPPGAFAGLTTAEDGLTNALGNLDRLFAARRDASAERAGRKE